MSSQVPVWVATLFHIFLGVCIGIFVPMFIKDWQNIKSVFIDIKKAFSSNKNKGETQI